MTSNPEISYIVSTFHRTTVLHLCLASIAAQKHRDFEVLVTDNSIRLSAIHENRKLVRSFGKNFRYLHTAPKLKVSDCYWSSELGVAEAHGRWISFPCDDCIYPDYYTRFMLTSAAEHGWNLVLSGNAILGPETDGCRQYRHFRCGAQWPGNKASFLIERELFLKLGGWRDKPKTSNSYAGIDTSNLRRWIQHPGVLSGHCPQLWYFHN